MTIILTGGGTAGSVTPLLAVAEQMTDYQFCFIGTKTGVERSLVPQSMRYYSIAAGKLRRYWSWQNLFDPIFTGLGFFQSLILMLRLRPKAVITAGSFVSVPVIWAAWCCGIRTVVHQQDLRVGLATRLMSPCARLLTKAFADIPLRGAECIGNPVRALTPTTDTIKLDPNYKTVLIFGGGTGAQALNNLVTPALCEFANIIHITGPNKATEQAATLQQADRYHRYTLLRENMAEALHKADLIVCRAGLGTISELAALSKPAIVIPMPQSHQQVNADFLQRHQAAVVCDQTQLTAELLASTIQGLLNNQSELDRLAQAMARLNPSNAAMLWAEKIRQVS